jgi:CPA1 family monovalent cation:H+ antiporter
VAAGLYISWNGLRLISAPTRLQGIFFWDLLMYVIEGLVFLLTGLQARPLLAGIKSYSSGDLIISAVVVSLAVILTRFAWMYPATYIPRWLSPALARRDPSPRWQVPFVVAFTGVRGIVSLAAALALPLVTVDGDPFPHRDLLLLLSFVVVLVTLVGQGLALPIVIKALGLADAGRREHAADRVEEFRARRLAIEGSLSRLHALADELQLPTDISARLNVHHMNRLELLDNRNIEDEEHQRRVKFSDDVEVLLLGTERDLINDLYVRGDLKDETRRRIERELDLREAHLASLRNDPAS